MPGIPHSEVHPIEAATTNNNTEQPNPHVQTSHEGTGKAKRKTLEERQLARSQNKKQTATQNKSHQRSATTQFHLNQARARTATKQETQANAEQQVKEACDTDSVQKDDAEAYAQLMQLAKEDSIGKKIDHQELLHKYINANSSDPERTEKRSSKNPKIAFQARAGVLETRLKLIKMKQQSNKNNTLHKKVSQPVNKELDARVSNDVDEVVETEQQDLENPTSIESRRHSNSINNDRNQNSKTHSDETDNHSLVTNPHSQDNPKVETEKSPEASPQGSRNPSAASGTAYQGSVHPKTVKQNAPYASPPKARRSNPVNERMSQVIAKWRDKLIEHYDRAISAVLFTGFLGAAAGLLSFFGVVGLINAWNPVGWAIMLTVSAIVLMTSAFGYGGLKIISDYHKNVRDRTAVDV
ncbi:MAG: hypothetical protein HUJ26_17380 [Planctomycetaceae bacterium]|nr:hypothetical protein [Planctomycetaceae bacterium]